jgi:hypothetical protein
MPGIEHNGIVEMFRENPALAPHVLALVFHKDVPPHASVRVADSALDQLIPIEFRADLVLELFDDAGKIVLAIVFEAQREKKPRKKYTWAVYWSVARAERECPAVVLVVAPDAEIATWAAEKVDLGLGLAFIQPLVLGPATLPVVTDPTAAASEVELTILSAMAHGNGPEGLAVVTAALTALGGLDREHAAVYFQIIWNVLREPMQRALEALVMERQTEGKVQFPPFAQRIFDRGELEGRTEEAARAVLTVLRVRGIAVPEAARERILAERDPARLERWHERAILAPSVAEVIGEPS